jgi:acylphosphatase
VDVSRAHESLAGHHGFRGAVFTEARELGLRGYIQLFYVATGAIPGLAEPRTFELVLEGPEQDVNSFRVWLDNMKVCLATHPWFPPGFAVVPAFPISTA